MERAVLEAGGGINFREVYPFINIKLIFPSHQSQGGLGDQIHDPERKPQNHGRESALVRRTA